MTPDLIQVHIEGLEEALKKLTPDLYAEPLKTFWTRSAAAVQGRAREKAPHDTGRLRNSIVYQIDDASPAMYAVVGTDVFYAPYQEFGTVPHFVPAKFIGRWAELHGFGYTGLWVSGEAHPYLTPGFEESASDMDSYLGAMASEIAARWSA